MHSKSLRRLGLIAVAAMALGGIDAANAAKITMRLAENQPESNPVSVAMHHFAKLVAEKTNDEVEVVVYTAAQLGQEPETIEQAQLGVIEFARVNSVVVGNVVKEVGVFTLPYVFRNIDHKFTVLDGKIGRTVDAALEKQGLVNLGYMEAGTRSFYTIKGKQIKSLADLRGKKIRVQPAPISIQMVKLLGATPTPMNYGEVYSALETGVIDGAENDYVSYVTSGHFEVAPFYTEDNHLSPPAMLLMNKDKLDSLSEKHRKAILAAGKEAAVFERGLMVKGNEEAKKKAIAAGVVITTVDNTPFRAAVKDIYDTFPEYTDILKQIGETK